MKRNAINGYKQKRSRLIWITLMCVAFLLISGCSDERKNQADDSEIPKFVDETGRTIYSINIPFDKESVLAFVNEMISYSDIPMEVIWNDDDARYDETGYVVYEYDRYENETNYVVVLEAKLRDIEKERIEMIFTEDTYGLSNEVCRIQIISHEKHCTSYTEQIGNELLKMFGGSFPYPDLANDPEPFDLIFKLKTEDIPDREYYYSNKALETWSYFYVYDATMLSD